METLILLSWDLGYIEPGKLEILQVGIGELERVLKALIKSLEKNTRPLESSNRTLCINLSIGDIFTNSSKLMVS